MPIVVVSLANAACFGGQAKLVAMEPLQMPEPPPRVVEVSNPEVPPPVPLPEEPDRTVPSTVRTTPTRPPEPPRRVEPPKVEPTVDVAKPPEEPRPPTVLQTTPAQQEGELERRIRTLQFQATNTLNRVNYQALNPDGRTQYDTAKRFIAQSEDAVQKKNLVFAHNLADKAAALASQLSGR